MTTVYKILAVCAHVKAVSLLGSNEKIEWKQDKEGLHVNGWHPVYCAPAACMTKSNFIDRHEN